MNVGGKYLEVNLLTEVMRVKVRRAAQLLLFQRHREPGVKGWELKRALGKNYLKVLEILDSELEKIGLQVKMVKPKDVEDLDKARFMITVREPLNVGDATSSGWRIDEIAALAASVAFIISKHGKVQRRELEELLEDKFPKWFVEYSISKFIGRGYLKRESGGVLTLGWRAEVEVDKKLLLNLILRSKTEQS
jgi:RNase P/RNase MRP subunit POP5